MNAQPNFFVVGAPKCGTTSLHAYLAEHPDICMSNPKEPAYWSFDFTSPLFRSTPTSYADCFSDYCDQSRIGESTSCYLYSKVAAENIFNNVPGAKIIAMLRNPVTMVPALHAQYLKMGMEDIASLRDALKAEHARAEGIRIPSRFPFPKEFLLYRQVAKYSEQVQRYQRLFKPENFLVVLFEDFIENTPQVYAQICDFLGVSTQFAPEFSSHNTSQVPRFVRLQRFARQATQIPLPKMLSRIKPVDRAFESGKTQMLAVVSRLNLTKSTRKLDDATRRELSIYYQQEINQLESVLGRSLDCWRK